MTKMFAVDDQNDLFIAPGGNLAIVTDLQAVLEACAHKAKAQLGEMILNTDQGLPTFDTVWQGASNVPQYRSALLAALVEVDGVVSVLQLSTQVSNGVLSYAATIQTVYGQGEING